MAHFGDNLATASQHAHAAREQLNGATNHQAAAYGISNAVDLGFYVATVLKTFARLVDASIANSELPESTTENIAALRQMTHTAMHKQAEAARSLRELSDFHREFLARREVDTFSRLDGKSRR